MLKFSEFIVENSFTDFDLQTLVKRFVSKHPKSSYALIWQNYLADLIAGKVDSLERSKFRTKMGAQYGLEFIDDLVQYGHLAHSKVGRKEFISLPNSMEKKMNDIVEDVRKRFEVGQQIQLDTKSKKITYELNAMSHHTDHMIRKGGLFTEVLTVLQDALDEAGIKYKTSTKVLGGAEAKISNRYSSNDLIAIYSFEINFK